MNYTDVTVAYGRKKWVTGGKAAVKDKLCTVTGDAGSQFEADVGYSITGKPNLAIRAWWVDSRGDTHQFKVE